VDSKQATKQIVEREVHQPPTLAGIGQFADLTPACCGLFQDLVSDFGNQR
jgi:hypothetical protein